MTTVNGSGVGNDAIYYALENASVITAASDTILAVSGGYGQVYVLGTGFTYNNPQAFGGTINEVVFSNGTYSEDWSGLNVAFADASQALYNGNQAAFSNAFFGGNDTFTYAIPADPFATGSIILNGYGGDDVFNIYNWNRNVGIDGDSGSDTLNIIGGLSGTINTDYQSDSNFAVRNVEQINLLYGSNYTIIADANLVASGNTLTIDASALGAANSFVFNTYVRIGPVVSGNLVLIGGAGNDIFQGGSGNNTFIGGAGSDTVSFAYGRSGNQTGVTVDLGVSGAQSVGGPYGGTDTFQGIENLIGTVWDDTLSGDANDNVLNGDGGNDTLNGRAGFDTAVFANPYSTYVITHVSNTVTVAGSEGTTTLTGVEMAQFSDQTVHISGPVVATNNIRVAAGQMVAAPNLFTVTDLSGNAITGYQLWDGTGDPNSGHWVVNGVARAPSTIINISAAQLAQTYYVGGTVNDGLQIRAYDGTSWSASDARSWSPFTAGPTVNHPPSVSVSTSNIYAHLQTLSLSGMVSTSDQDGDPITEYQLWDSTRDLRSGHFMVNGVAQAAGTVIDISAAQLAQTSFVTGQVSDSLQIRAYDGISWSAPENGNWSPFTINVAEAYPHVTTANLSKAPGQSLALSSLFSVVDNDGDPITEYQLWDGSRDPNSGYFTINGVAQAAGTILDIPAAQLGQVAFVTGTVGDSLQIRASDGVGWSAADNAAWAPFTVSLPPPNHAPVVTTQNLTLRRGDSVILTGFATMNDFEGDAITKYQLWDSTRDPNSGHWVVDGVAQPAGQVIEATGAQTITYVAGLVGDSLQIRVFDGSSWSAADNASWSPFNTIVINNAPVVTTGNLTKSHFQTLAFSSLFAASDGDGDAMTKYQLWDSSRDPNSGHWVVGGVAQSAGQVVEITAAQAATASFVTGSVGDSLQIRAYDGLTWSAADNAGWAPFNITVPANNTPVITTGNLAESHLQTLAFSSLFSVNDADGDAMTKYQLWDSTRDVDSGHWVVDGVARAAGTVIEITAAQAATASFVTGSVGDSLQIRAYDGLTWSAADNAGWAPFNITVPANRAPVVTTSDVASSSNQTIALSSLISVSDADGDSMTRYQLWDSTRDADSGHWVVDGVARAPGTVIDITAAQLASTAFLTGTAGDLLQVRAFDGMTWSAGDNASWSPFHVAT